MCPEVFEIVQKMDISSVETRLALQCAPVITGIKPANLLIVSSGDELTINRILKDTSLHYYRLFPQDNKTIYLLFEHSLFMMYLYKPKVQHMFQAYGYGDLTLNGILETFQCRYETYRRNGGDFPHEIGLLLGYPIEDVEGFIANKGKNYLYAGYWKVYENVEEKKLLFEAYESAKDGVLLLVANGYKMKSIIRGIQSSKNPKDWMQTIKKQK